MNLERQENSVVTWVRAVEGPWRKPRAMGSGEEGHIGDR